jgi:hypothetical protein
MTSIRLIVPLLCLGAYGFFWTTFQGSPYEATVFFIRVCFVSVVYVSAFTCAAVGLIGPRWLVSVAWAILLSALLSQISGRVLHVSSIYDGGFAFPGVTGDPSLLAATVLAILPSFLIVPITPADALGASLALTSLAGTQRRSAVVGAAAAFGALCLFILARRRHLRLGSVVAVLACGVLVYLAATSTPLAAELLARFDERTGSGRAVFQQLALSHLLERGLVDTLCGEGVAAIRDFMTQSFGIAIGSHNDWLDIVFGTGLVGLSLFLWFHLRLFRQATRMRDGFMGVAFVSMAQLVIIELTAGGALDPSAVASFVLYGVLSGRHELARRSIVGSVARSTFSTELEAHQQ